MNRIRRYNESHIESFSKQEKEIIMEIFNDFVEEYDISHYDPDDPEHNVEELWNDPDTFLPEELSTYFIRLRDGITSGFSYDDKSYTSINIYFQIYNEKDYKRIVEGLKVLSSSIKEYMNQDCCLIRGEESINNGRMPFNKKWIEFFIADAEAIKWIRQGHFNKWNTLKEI